MAKVKSKEAARAIKFALFSASAGIIEFVSIALLDAVTSWRHFYCYLVGLVLSVLWNFTLNRRYTFKSANNVPIAMLKVACFYAVFTPLSTWLDKVLTEDLFTPLGPWFDKVLTEHSQWLLTPLGSWLDKVRMENLLPGMLATVLIMLTNFVTEFLYDRFFVFKNTLDTNDLAKREQEREAAAE